MEIRTLKNAIRESRHIVCMLGLAVAADCGCYNYRDSDNAYAVEMKYGYSPEEIFSASLYSTRPKVFFDYYRNHILNQMGTPGPALETLRRMEDDGLVHSVITRSIYGLPRRAGIRNCVEIHGSVYENRCPHCGRQYSMEYVRDASGIPLCENCGTPVRPQIVLDGEMIPNSLITASAGEVEKADTLLVLGCSLKSTLAKNAIKYFEGSKIILINEEENYSDNIADLVFHGKPRDILPMIYT
ncbi:MAG: Sir2 family NAD-dependent protein deacetylase [Lachnospiraceae bacterium]|nr:Sir2 family NAD-dependent protein deacetylase [Lachnospiraceae bacterium]